MVWKCIMDPSMLKGIHSFYSNVFSHPDGRAFNTDLLQLLQQYGWEMAWLQSTSHRLKSPAAALLSSNIQFVFYVQLWIKYLSEVFELVYIIFIYILHSVTTFGEPGAVYRCCINGGKCSIVKTLVDFKYWRTKHHYESSLSRVWSISWLTSDPRAPLCKLFSNPITGHKMRI